MSLYAEIPPRELSGPPLGETTALTRPALVNDWQTRRCTPRSELQGQLERGATARDACPVDPATVSGTVRPGR